MLKCTLRRVLDIMTVGGFALSISICPLLKNWKGRVRLQVRKLMSPHICFEMFVSKTKIEYGDCPPQIFYKNLHLRPHMTVSNFARQNFCTNSDAVVWAGIRGNKAQVPC